MPAHNPLDSDLPIPDRPRNSVRLFREAIEHAKEATPEERTRTATQARIIAGELSEGPQAGYLLALADALEALNAEDAEHD